MQVTNDLAQRRAEDNSLEDLIDQGRQEIAEGQEEVEALLVEIIGNQNATLEAVEEATQTVEALEEMTKKSLEAQAAIQVSLREQMNAIKIAYQQNLITLDQAKTASPFVSNRRITVGWRIMETGAKRTTGVRQGRPSRYLSMFSRYGYRT